MGDFGNKEVFASNLRRLMESNGIKRTQVAEILKVPYTTVNDWYNGITYPRIDKIELLARLFGVMKSELVEQYSPEKQWYLNPETQEVAQEIAENKELSLLFDAARDATPDDLRLAHSMLLALKRKERGEE